MTPVYSMVPGSEEKSRMGRFIGTGIELDFIFIYIYIYTELHIYITVILWLYYTCIYIYMDMGNNNDRHLFRIFDRTTARCRWLPQRSNALERFGGAQDGCERRLVDDYRVLYHQ